MALTPGARFQQLQPIIAAAVGNQDTTTLPVTLITVPAGATYRLRYTQISVSLCSSTAYAGGLANVSAFVHDSNGNTYAEAECCIAAASQSSANGQKLECDGAVLPGGTVVSINVGGTNLAAAGVFVKIGGGAVWRTA